MSDLEQRVQETLTRAAGDAPPADGLAAAARGRARGRRRARVAGAAAVSVAVVVVPVALALGGGPGAGPVAPDPGGSTSPSPPPDSGPPVPAGWRVEAWRGLSVAVPADWTVGGRSAWCASDGEPDVPVVERPDTPVLAIGCVDPQYSLGLTFGSSAAYDTVYPSGHVWRYERGDVEMYLDGSWLGHWYDDERLLQVNAADRETVERILASVQVADEG